MIWELFPWFVKRRFVFERDRYVCQYCGSNKDLAVDHIWPRAKGGTDDLNNLMTACQGCNSSKHDKTMREWIEFLRGRPAYVPPSEDEMEENQDTDFVIPDDICEPPKITGVFGISKNQFLDFVELIKYNESLGVRRFVGKGHIFTQAEYDPFLYQLMTFGIVDWISRRDHRGGRAFTQNGVAALLKIRDRLMDIGDEEEPVIDDLKVDASIEPELGPTDEKLLEDAIELFNKKGRGSISMLQANLDIGYPRASRLVKILEDRGIIGPLPDNGMYRKLLGKQENDLFTWTQNKQEEGF